MKRNTRILYIWIRASPSHTYYSVNNTEYCFSLNKLTANDLFSLKNLIECSKEYEAHKAEQIM